MFKLFKELIDSVKEGMAEGRAELAQEAAEREAKLQETGAALDARLAASSRFENFAVALAAVYRETFASDLREAEEARRSAVHLLCIGIPDKEIEPWKKLLDRDFSVTDGESAEATVATIAGDLPSQPNDGDLALWIGRASHLATGAAAVGHVEAHTALAWLVPVVELAVERFSGWDDYARSFLAGERDAPGSNFVGRKLLASATEKLLENERSPWKTVAWPTRDELPALLASRPA